MLNTVNCGGSGERIVLLHGFGSDHHSWIATTPELSSLGEVWAVDLPGHGDSWEITPEASLEAIAAQLTTSVLGDGSGPVHLVGHSLGGALAIMLASEIPERVAALSLIAPLGLGAVKEPEFMQQLPGLVERQSVHEALQTLVVNPRLISRQLAPMLLSQLERPGVRLALGTIAKAVAGSADALENAIKSVVSRDVQRMVIWGLQDTVNPLNQTTKAGFGGRWHCLEACGHLPQVEQRLMVNQYLMDFIKK